MCEEVSKMVSNPAGCGKISLGGVSSPKLLMQIFGLQYMQEIEARREKALLEARDDRVVASIRGKI